MNNKNLHFSNYPFLAAFIIGVTLFTIFWKSWFGSASSGIVLAGMVGVAVTVISFWLWYKLQHINNKEE